MKEMLEEEEDDEELPAEFCEGYVEVLSSSS